MIVRPRNSAAPPGYDITTNELWQKMQSLYGEYRMIGEGLFHTIIVVGPPGVGKSRGAEEYLTAGGCRLVTGIRPTFDQLYDTLYRYRHSNIVLVFDDTDYVFDSVPIMNVLKVVADAKGRREIVDPRKNGHGRFTVHCRFVFITNKPINDPKLMAYDAKARDHIDALKSRFQLRTFLSFDPLDCYHFACWLATDGKHLLRDAVRYQGRSLTIGESNEVLAWFANNFNRLTEVSPRTLIDNIADYRLKTPDAWLGLAEQWCDPEPRMIGTGKFTRDKTEIMEPAKNPPPWVIQKPSVVQKHDEPALPEVEQVIVEPEPQVVEPEPQVVEQPTQKMQVILHRSGRGLHPLIGTIEADEWEAAVAASKIAPPNRPSLHKAFRQIENGTDRAEAAIVVASYYFADRLSEDDMEKYSVASVTIGVLPPASETPSRREAKNAELLEKLHERRAQADRERQERAASNGTT